MDKQCHQRTILVIGVLSVLAVYSEVSAGEALKLVVDNRPNATIVLAEKPRAAAQLAAHELQHYIKKISGAKLTIVREPTKLSGNRILVGESKAARDLGYANKDFRNQEYLIKTLPNTLVLMGRDDDKFFEIDYASYNSLYKAASGPLATCYAVHDFLEKRLGVRWYYPNEEIGEVLATSATVAVKDLNIRRSPDAPVRPVYPLFSNTKTLYFNDWDERQKFQSSMVDARQSLLYWIRNRHWASMKYNANHSFHGYDAAFGKSHPEWFSTKSYAKMQQLRYQSEVQPCLTSPGFFEQVVKIARDYYDGKKPVHPDVVRAASGNFFPVVMNDNTNMCSCPTCRAQYRNDAGATGNASHYVWSFANRVAREVRKTHPNAMISGLGYFNYTKPPQGMIFEPNVAVTFCKFYEGYWDRNYRERDHQRIAEYVDRNKAKFFTTWEYLLHPWYTEWCFPCLVPHVHDQDVKRLKQMGFQGGTLQYLYLDTYRGKTRGGLAWASPVLDFMNMYWRMKLYDDFDLDIDQGLNEYYVKFFGPGGADMKKFYTAMENRWMDPKVRKRSSGGSNARVWWGHLGTRKFLDEVAGHIQQAKAATGADSIYRKRVDLIDAGIMQYLLKARARYEKSSVSEFAPIATAAAARVGALPSKEKWYDDATWTDALPNEIQKTAGNQPVSHRTIFKLAHDDEHLFIHAVCLEPNVSQIKADTRDNDDTGVFEDDSIELFVDPAGRGESYYHFCLNNAGAVYDAREDPTAPGATATVTWNSGIKARTARGKNHWELRAALPWSGLVKQAPQAGETWRFNLCRNRRTERDKPPFSAWSPTLGGFRKPSRFGVITFNSPAERGRTLWNCNFQSKAFATQSGERPLIGINGWYENTLYANRGWNTSWKVVERDGNHMAVGDINKTNTSDMVPVHTVKVSPGTISVEAMFRRHAVSGNMPTIQVYDLQHRHIVYMFAWEGRNDLVAIEEHPDRHVFGDKQHGLGEVSRIGKWFGLKAVIDMTRKEVVGYVKKEGGQWVRLNQKPIPFLNPKANGTTLCISVGTRKHRTVKNNILEMDDIRVRQLLLRTPSKK